MGAKSFWKSGAIAFPPLASAALLFVSSSAVAQPDGMDCPTPPSVRALRVGSCFRSSIGPEDPKTQDSTPYEDWRLDLEAGETVQIDLEAVPTGRQSATGRLQGAYTFDTYLELRRDGAAAPLASNDDREGSLNSRILFTAPATDHYIVRARPLFAGEGDYRLSVSRPPAPLAPTPIDAGFTRIEFGTGRPPGDGTGSFPTRLFSFGGAAGDIVRFSLDADVSLNFRMELTAPDGVILGEIGELGGIRALAAILPVAGTYQLRLRMTPTATRLNFQRRVAGPPPAPQRIVTGQTVEGEIGFDSRVGLDPSGGGALSFSDIYQVQLRAGEPVTVTLISHDFDPVLDAGSMSDLVFAATVTNDDFGDGRNSLLVLRRERSGSTYLRVRALGDGIGRYRLTVRPGDASVQQQAPAPPNPRN